MKLLIQGHMSGVCALDAVFLCPFLATETQHAYEIQNTIRNTLARVLKWS